MGRGKEEDRRKTSQSRSKLVAVNGFTPTEKRILTVLSDGQAHRREELHKCLPDELAALEAIQPHISRLRKKLSPVGEDIICTLKARQIHYQHVRLISSSYDGRM